MAFVEQTELNAKFPPALFRKGQDLGLKGAPIPQDVFNNFIAYLDIYSRFIELTPAEKREYELAAAAASSRSDVREDLPQTGMQAALDAAMMVAGYAPGIWDFMAGVGEDGLRRASIEDMATLSPHLIQGSKDGARGYITGYSLRRPAHLEEGGELGKDVSVADAHTLGVIVKAATLRVRVGKGEVPTDVSEWAAFESGMDRENGDKRVSELLSEAIEAHRDLTKLQRVFVLGRKISSRIPA
jgi:hypothetical protein